MNQELARSIAKQIYLTYESNVPQMLINNYKGMGRQFVPTQQDTNQYAQILDADGNGRITLSDIEALCVKYLTQSAVVLKQPKKYTKQALERLEVARRLFNKFDEDGSGFITDEEVRGLLIETYKQVGVVYEPTEQDVRSWVEMTDTNGDGQISLEEFQDLVIKSLRIQGIEVFIK